jgi:anaerobic selenocysteine-containing dehydrogenase
VPVKYDKTWNMNAVENKNRTTLVKRQESIRTFDTVRRTTCGNCPAGCGAKVFLKDGVIVDIFGDEDHPANKGSFCPKGLLSLYHLRNPNRLTEPRIRENLDAPFRAVGWDEALEFTAGGLRRETGARGSESLFIIGAETAPTDFLLGGDRFGEALGTPNRPSRLHPAPFHATGKVAGMFGVPASQLLMNTPRDWCNSRCIVVYGSDLAASDPMTLGPVIDARDRGTSLVVIDSRRSMTAMKATVFLQVRPGSHATALKGIIHILFRDQGVDRDFLAESTEGFERLESDLTDFTPEHVADACAINPDDLAQAAALIGRGKPLQFIAGDWNTRRRLSDEDLCLGAALVCLRGSVGIPGGGLNLLNVSPFSGGDGPAPHGALEDVLLDSGKPVGAMICHGNPFAGLAGGQATRAAFRDVPLVVHCGSYADETSHNAHVSIPLSFWLEYSGLVAHGNGRAIQWRDKVVEAPGRCRSPLEFWTDLGHACGVGDFFPWRADDGAVDARAAADFFLQRNPLTRAASVEALDPEKNPPGGLLWPCVDESDLEFEEDRFIRGDVRGKNILFRRRRTYPLGDKRFPTLSGKVQYPTFSKNDGTDPATASSPALPLMLTTGVPVDSVPALGQFVSDRTRQANLPPIRVHPRIAKLLDLRGGDPVVVENDRGAIGGALVLDSGLDPRVIWCADGIDPHQPHYGGDGPLSLFAHAADPFAWVSIHCPDQDTDEAFRRLATFLHTGEAGT